MVYHHMGTFGFFPFGLVGGLSWLLVAVAAGLLLFLLIRSAGSGGWSGSAAVVPPPPGPAPLDILARRFAAGEISAEEYQKARDILKS